MMIPFCLPLFRLVGLSLLLLGGHSHALEATPVADGVYAFLGDNGEATPVNGGFVANSGFIVGPEGVVVIDSGASLAHGKAMLAEIDRRTGKPVELVIITHAIQDFVFGAAAFAERGIPLLAQRRTVDLMKARCENCLAHLIPLVGETAMSGTRLVLPGRVVENSQRITAGGRTIDLLYLGWASTPGDLVVHDPQSGVTFTGGMVTAERIPELRDADFDGWLKALEQLATLDTRHLVPGYGPIQLPAAVVLMADYLRALDERMRALYSAGVGLSDAVDQADLAAFSGWALYPDLHRRNALRRYLHLEVEDLETPPQ
ncbi:MAG: MBL fold metallo-hydrolase [Betaproteobacteria bacterium]|nr:MBL fold metallo-hydrolase [Betaproteobacteria bacterium]